MKKILFFTQIINSYTSRRLVEEAKCFGLEPRLISYGEVQINFDGKDLSSYQNLKELPPAEYANLGALGYDSAPWRRCLLTILESKGVRVLNAESLKKYPELDSKIFQHFLFQKHKFPFIKTTVAGGREIFSQTKIDLPMIIKEQWGSKGKQVYKVKSQKELYQLDKKYRPMSLLIQPFLQTGEDLRVIVLGGKIMGAMRRIVVKGGYLANYSAGGTIENYEINKDKKAGELALRVASTALVEYGGIDLMKDDQGNWKILEINRPCQFEGFEKITGVNMAGKIVKYLMSR